MAVGVSACAGRAARIQQPSAEIAERFALTTLPQPQQTSLPPQKPGRVTRAPKPNFFLPIVEIVGMDALINAAGRRGPEGDAYRVTSASIRANLRGPWIVDNDPFAVNQMMHPYQGAMYHTIARSAGLNYWQALGYTFAGSAMWEIADETTTPALNDQLASGIAGTCLGEALFRMANLLVDRSHDHVSCGRGLLVAFVSPPTAINRVVFGKRFDGVMETHDPAYDLRLDIGARGTTQHTAGPSLDLAGQQAIADLMVEYGMPARPAYPYTRPFDYFRLDFRAASGTTVERLTTHGVLAGRRYGAGTTSGGVWGLYGIYDYLSPQFFRVSTTAVAAGTTAERFLSGDAVLVQVTALGGVGYGAVHTVGGASETDYHYGVTPQAVETLRVVTNRRVSFDVAARQYFITEAAGFDTAGTDTVLRAEGSVTVKVYRRNGLTLRYETTRRTATFPGFGPQKQSISTVSLTYTVLGPQRLGAVKR
jgi:hypothetical protein